MQGQLRRVLVEGNLVGCVVRGDEDLEIAPQRQRDQDGEKRGPADLVPAPAPEHRIGEPCRDDDKQAG